MFADVVVIGAGVAGCCTARELARYELDVLVLEAGLDIANGATRANSGIVHAGFDPEPGTAKARFNAEGMLLMPQWAKELGFGYYQNGAMVIALDESGLPKLEALRQRAVENGVPEVFVISGKEARTREPNLPKTVAGALDVPASALCDPYGLTYAAAENAAENGVRFVFDARVSLVRRLDCTEDGARFELTCEDGRTVRTKTVVNATGIYADEFNNMVSASKITHIARRGDYCLFDTEFGRTFSRTIFQTPTAQGKGVLVSPTIHGNLFVGPNAVAQDSKTDVSTTRSGLDEITEKARSTWPDINLRGMITNFAGIRSTEKNGDFVIGEAPDAPGFFNIAGYDSPGLSSAPAVATYLASHVAQSLNASAKESFNPHRSAPALFALMTSEQRKRAIEENPSYGRIVCRCCNVSEGELVDAMHRPLPVLSLDALKWRTGAMMGRCHGGFCSPEIVHLMARELNMTPEHVSKRMQGSNVVSASRPDYLEAVLHEEATPPGIEADPSTIYDVIVVGGGAAGLAAASSASASGAKQVLLIDREPKLGGVMKQCIHDGFGLHRFGEQLTGPEFAQREQALLDVEAITVLNDATVLEAHAATSPEGYRACIVTSPRGLSIFLAKSLVLATGSRERGSGALNMAGSRPSGVFSAGSAQNFINLQGCLPGKRAVVLGSGDIGLIMARRMTLSGMSVEGVYELMRYPSGLKRNIAQCLNDFAIPLHLSSTVVRLEGKDRLEAVWVAEVDPETLKPLPGTERRIACDTLLLSVGLIPENELAKGLGTTMDPVSGGPVVNDTLSTSVPGVFSCGNSLHVHDLADFAAQEGDIAGAQAAAWALGHANHACTRFGIPLSAGPYVRSALPHFVQTENPQSESVVISLRVSQMVSHPKFVVEGTLEDGSVKRIARKAAMVAVPAEMIQVKIQRSDLAGCTSLTVRVEGQE